MTYIHRTIITGFVLAMSLFSLLAIAADSEKGGDPYEPVYLVAKGPHLGEFVNTANQRALKVIHREALSLEVANISHAGKFWRATIALNEVDDVIFLIEHFKAAVPAAHSELRIHFKKPVTLIEQTESHETYQTTDLAYSIEAVAQKNETYDLVKGMQNQFAIAYRMTSLSDEVQSTAKAGRRVEQFRMALSSAERAVLVQNAILDSERFGMGFMYHTLKRNCTNELFRLFDRNLEYSSAEHTRLHFSRIAEIYPPMALLALKTRGLFKEQLVDLKDDPSVKH